MDIDGNLSKTIQPEIKPEYQFVPSTSPDAILDTGALASNAPCDVPTTVVMVSSVPSGVPVSVIMASSALCDVPTSVILAGKAPCVIPASQVPAPISQCEVSVSDVPDSQSHHGSLDTTQSNPQEKLGTDIATIIKSMLSNENTADAFKNKIRTLPSSSGLIKCPIYCRHNCVVQHHPLLVAILNCVDTEEMELMDMKLSILKSVINKYRQSSSKWKCDDIIPDVFNEYRYPILHWACMLGRVGAAVWLVGYQYCEPTTRAFTQKAETALHKALLFLQETSPKNALRKFVQLLAVMEPALSIPDKYGNTPIHLCCEMLRTEMSRPEFYRECLLQMLMEMSNSRDEDYLTIVLNMTNYEGETPLHLLTRTDRYLQQIKLLVKYGASPLIKNKEGLTPVDLTERRRYVPAYNYIVSVLNKKGINYGGKLFLTNTVSDHPMDFDTKVVADSQTNLYASPMRLIRTRVTSQDLEQGVPAKRSRTSERSGSSDSSVPDLHGLLGDVGDQGDMKAMAGYHGDMDADTGSPGLLSPISLAEHQFSPLELYEQPSQEEEAIQQFFQETVKEQQQRRLNKVVKQEEPALPHTDVVSEAVSLFETAMGNKDSILIQACVDKLMTLDQEAQLKVVESLADTRNTTTKNLQFTTKAIDRIQQMFRETKQKQETLVSSIMTIVDRLGNLQKEEQEIDKEISNFTEKEDATEATNTLLKERLKNCENAIEILKRLHQECRRERKKTS